MNRNVNKGNVDTSTEAYTSQKEQNYRWLPFIYLIKTQFVFIEFRKLAKCRICNMRAENIVYSTTKETHQSLLGTIMEIRIKKWKYIYIIFLSN